MDLQVSIGLYHLLDGVTNPQYKMLHFLTITFFYKENKALAFNRDRCCYLALCLRLILFHCIIIFLIISFFPLPVLVVGL